MADMYTQTALVGGARWVGLEGLGGWDSGERRGARQQRRGFGERDGWWFRCAYRETARPVSDRSRLDASEWGWVWFEAKSGTGWQDRGPTCSGVRLWGQSVPRSGPRRRPGRCSCRRSRPRLGEHSRRGEAGPGVRVNSRTQGCVAWLSRPAWGGRGWREARMKRWAMDDGRPEYSRSIRSCVVLEKG